MKIRIFFTAALAAIALLLSACGDSQVAITEKDVSRIQIQQPVTNPQLESTSRPTSTATNEVSPTPTKNSDDGAIESEITDTIGSAELLEQQSDEGQPRQKQPLIPIIEACLSQSLSPPALQEIFIDASRSATDAERITIAHCFEDMSIRTVDDRPSSPGSLPDLSYFATNKSDRFLVDFEDIIAGHPHVGQRSPVPHNDAQIYFSNTDPRWINATKPSDYPAVYAVADGIIQMAQGDMAYYNVRDHTDYDPPWWHVAYGFNIDLATEGDTVISFIYSLEPYITLEGKPKNFFKDFILVRDGQRVKKGDLVAYMYVPPFEEKINVSAASHIAFSLTRQGQGEWDVYVPAIFTENIVDQFGTLYRNPKEGWNSPSYGNDWSRGRGKPTGMGWMIDASENPFGDEPLDVLMYDGIRDKDLDGTAHLDPAHLGFHADDLVISFSDNGGFESQILEFDAGWQVMFGSIGGPASFGYISIDDNEQREINIAASTAEQGYTQTISRVIAPGSYMLRVSDSEKWGWAIAIAPAGAPYTVPGTNQPVGICPPGCPPLPSRNNGDVPPAREPDNSQSSDSSQSESVSELPTLDSLTRDQEVVASFTGSGDQDLIVNDTGDRYSLVIVATGGPIAVHIAAGISGPRDIYQRPAAEGTAIYATSIFEAGQADISVRSGTSISWLVIVIQED